MKKKIVTIIILIIWITWIIFSTYANKNQTVYYSYGEISKENYQSACENDEILNKKYEEISEKYGENSWQADAFLLEYKLVEEDLKNEDSELSKELNQAMELGDWVKFAQIIQASKQQESYKKEFDLRIKNGIEYKFDYLNQAIKNYSDSISLKDVVSKKQAKEEKEKALVTKYMVENKKNIIKTDTIEIRLQEFYKINEILIIVMIILISVNILLNKEKDKRNIIKILLISISSIILGIAVQIISAAVIYKTGFLGIPSWIIINGKLITSNPITIIGLKTIIRLPVYLIIILCIYSLINITRKSRS